MKLGDAHNLSDLRPRATQLAIFFVLCLGFLLVRLWYLQIWKGEEYRLFSDQNRFKVHKIAAPRGQIFDRNGKLLADNRPRFDVLYTSGYASDVEKEFRALQEIFNWSSSDFQSKFKKIKDAAAYAPRKIERDISWSELSMIEGNTFLLNGVDIEVLAARDYLYGDAFFHILGYTGEINERDLKRLKKVYPNRKYRLGNQIGVIGIESLYEGLLRGQDGKEFFVVDVKGRPVRRSGLKLFEQSAKQEAVAGHQIHTTLDLELQLAGVRAFKNRRGAAVAMDPQSGEVLAMISRPGLDPNLFTRNLSRQRLYHLRERKDKPFLDRTVGEHYPPGSTLKLIMATAALESGVLEPDTIINCGGYFRLGRRVWRDHNRAGFGKIAVREAIKRSSNVFFFNVGMDLGLDRISRWAKRFGLGERTNLGSEVFQKFPDIRRSKRFNSEQRGFIPNSEWVKRKGHTSIKAETVNAAIGQGGFLTTITQLARMTSMFGNEGKLFQPQLLRLVKSPNGEKNFRFDAVVESEIKLQEETQKMIVGGMSDVVNARGGTAWRARLKNFKAGGKTGTSQVVSLSAQEEGEDVEAFQDHAVFIGMAPVEKPKIAVAVIVENGGSGGKTAAPIARVMMQNYLNRLSKEPMLGQR